MMRDLLVRMVSPALIGGAEKNGCDTPSNLRLPSVRGQLRKWSRLLGGEGLATELWGSTETGQRVRFVRSRRLGRSAALPKAEESILIPPRAEAPMIPPTEDSILLRLWVPEDIRLPRLQAVVWTWLHLGAVGKRSRRGYGSLLWLPAGNGVLEDWPHFWPSHHLGDRQSLEDYLRLGLSKVWQVLEVEEKDLSHPDCEHRLVSLEQVFVGKALPGEWQVLGGHRGGGTESLESALHGFTEGKRGGPREELQLGSGTPRRPSPMRWRVFPVHGRRAYRPVLTWFPQGYAPGERPKLNAGSNLHKYLHDRLGFETSLAGTSLA